ncbi:MAG: hypothetical protein PHW04_16165 [Candidatus Wallbacteria bacterium]|nr:hypothetical protein [Candidatus Wallbacteria bacterium]
MKSNLHPFCGLAFWDLGEPNHFHHDHLAGLLHEFRHFQSACELQQEASYLRPDNKAWSRLNLQLIKGFDDFILENEFLSLHLPSSDVDITDCDPESSGHSIEETGEAIRFGFRLSADALVLHPGRNNHPGPWMSPDEAVKIQTARSRVFELSLQHLMRVYCREILIRARELESIQKKDKSLASLINCFHLLGQDIPASDQHRCAAEILDLIKNRKFPLWLVRHARNPQRGLHLCLENVEPPNFLINTPKQHQSWFERLRGIYQDELSRLTRDQELTALYRPLMLLDVNHLLHSKKILTEEQNRKYAGLFPDYDDLWLPFVKLPPDYGTEPLLNRTVRKFEDIFFFHLAGCNVYRDAMLTHEPVKALRNAAQTLISNGKPSQRYVTSQFNPLLELDLEETLQVIDSGKSLILEVFQRSPELMKSSLINTAGYLDFFRKEQDRLRQAVVHEANSLIRKLQAAYSDSPEIDLIRDLKRNIQKADFYIYPQRGHSETGKTGYRSAGFYLKGPNPVILATVDGSSGRIVLNF